MANTIGSTQAQYYIPEFWAAESLRELRNMLWMPRLVMRDTDFEPSRLGDVLHITVPGTFSANTKTAGSTVTLQQPTDAEVQLTLNTHKEATFLLEDFVRAVGKGTLMNDYIAHAVTPLAEAVENALLALYSGLSTTTGTSGVDLTYETFLGAKKELTDNKAPMARRAMVISTKDEMAILNDTRIERFLQNSRPESVAEGSIGRIAGFDTYVSQLVPTSGGTTYNLAFTPGAFILGMRPLPSDAPDGTRIASMVDPVSGLMVRVVMSYNADYLGPQITLDILFGVKELRDAEGIQVLA